VLFSKCNCMDDKRQRDGCPVPTAYIESAVLYSLPVDRSASGSVTKDVRSFFLNLNFGC